MKKASIFEPEQLERWVTESPESDVKKLAVILAYNAALRPGELYELRTTDCKLESNGNFVFVLRQRKTQRNGVQQAFNVPASITGWTSPGHFFRSVMDARQRHTHITGDYLFMQMRNGEMTNQRIGEKALSSLSRDIAKFLGLNEGNYQAYSFRRSAATTLANQGASVHQLRQFTGYHSLGVATEYIDSSKSQQQAMSSMLAVTTSKVSNDDTVQQNTSTSNPIHHNKGLYISPGAFQNVAK